MSVYEQNFQIAICCLPLLDKLAVMNSELLELGSGVFYL